MIYNVHLTDQSLPLPIQADKFHTNDDGTTTFHQRLPTGSFEEVAFLYTKNIRKIEEVG